MARVMDRYSDFNVRVGEEEQSIRERVVTMRVRHGWISRGRVRDSNRDHYKVTDRARARAEERARARVRVRAVAWARVRAMATVRAMARAHLQLIQALDAVIALLGVE